MKIRLHSLAALSFLGLTLIACNSVDASQPKLKSGVAQNQPAQVDASFPEDPNDPKLSQSAALDEGQILEEGASASMDTTFWADGQMRVDQKGAVEISVVPVNLSNPQQTIDFDVSLDTHSVDLSMDLAALASLRTDTGLEVKASGWNGASGGHHINGILSFPASIDGEALLNGAEMLELTILNLDAPIRVFTWER